MNSNTGIKDVVISAIKELAIKYDVVNLDGPVQTELREVIEQEGIILYERS